MKEREGELALPNPKRLSLPAALDLRLLSVSGGATIPPSPYAHADYAHGEDGDSRRGSYDSYAYDTYSRALDGFPAHPLPHSHSHPLSGSHPHLAHPHPKHHHHHHAHAGYEQHFPLETGPAHPPTLRVDALGLRRPASSGTSATSSSSSNSRSTCSADEAKYSTAVAMRTGVASASSCDAAACSGSLRASLGSGRRGRIRIAQLAVRDSVPRFPRRSSSRDVGSCGASYTGPQARDGGLLDAHGSRARAGGAFLGAESPALRLPSFSAPSAFSPTGGGAVVLDVPGVCGHLSRPASCGSAPWAELRTVCVLGVRAAVLVCARGAGLGMRRRGARIAEAAKAGLAWRGASCTQRTGGAAPCLRPSRSLLVLYSAPSGSAVSEADSDSPSGSEWDAGVGWGSFPLFRLRTLRRDGAPGPWRMGIDTVVGGGGVDGLLVA
ncbi:hypothetical protein FB451DRAFT_1366853 [Mycena latifolia]|nr:hypothetical protein FB451DRAFT_1366853 [Mycena latifolia]